MVERMDGRWLVSLCALILLGLHVAMRFTGSKFGEGFDSVAFGLIALGLVPWLGSFFDTVKGGGVEFKFRQLEDRMREQRGDIDTLQFLIGHFLGRSEMEHLQRLSAGQRFEIDVNIFPDEFKAELRHLRALGFIDNFPDRGIRSLYLPDAQTTKRDVSKYFFVTDSGRTFLRLRGAFA